VMAAVAVVILVGVPEQRRIGAAQSP
jgi:hypothetical protein